MLRPNKEKQDKTQQKSNSKVFPINNYFKYKQIKLPDQVRVAGRIKKKKIPTRCCLKEAQLRFEDTHALKVKARQKISMLVTGRSSHTYIRQNNFKSKTVARDTEGHYIMIKQSIHQEDVTIIYRFKDRALKYKANTDRSEGRNTHLYNNNRSYHLTFNNGHNPNRRSRRKQKT